MVDDSRYDVIAPLCESLGFERRKRGFEQTGRISSFYEMVAIVNTVLRQLAERKGQFVSLLTGGAK